MSEEFATIIKDVVERQNINEPKLELQSSTNKGDGYLSMIKFGKIIGTNKTLDVVLKCAHREPKTFAHLHHGVYLNEVVFYDKIMPTFRQFQAEHHISAPYDNTAAFYGAVLEVHHEIIAMQNLKMDNYDTWDRKQLMNEAHLTCALQTFAKFHGISFAMQQLNPKLFQRISGELHGDLFYRLLDEMKFFQQIKNILHDLRLLFHPEIDITYVDKLDDIINNVADEFTRTFRHDDHTVILQGDCWCGNAMYQYDDLSKRDVPKQMKMLDFQMCLIGSPVMDLSYFFYATAPKEAFDRLEHFLRVYHSALTEYLGKFQLRAEDVFSFDQLVEHWKKVARFGFLLTVGVRKIMLVESEDAPDITEDAVEFMDKLVMTPDATKLYHKQMRELIIHFIDCKFI